MIATYNTTNDKLKFWPETRLDSETYQRARRAGFQFWHGSKCFAAKWNPAAEDLIGELGGEITEDDTPDDVEARVSRFAGYASAASGAAESAQDYLDTRANTERRRANAIRALETGLSAAEHWQRRIRGAIAAATHKERPDVIARRIEGLEADRRRQVNSYTADTTPGERYGCPDHVFLPKVGRGGHWIKKTDIPAIQAHAERWIAHLDRRLEYERALLEAAGGLVASIGAAPLDKERFQVGGAVKARGYDWRLIAKVNRKTLDVYDPHCNWRKFWKVERSWITEVLTAAEARERLPHLSLPAAAPKVAKGPAKAANGQPCEVLGAVGYRSGFRCTGPADVWRLVVKVNRTTVETITKFSDSFIIYKKHASEAAEIRTAAEVKATMPELLDLHAEWLAMRERRAARLAAQDAAQQQAAQPQPMFAA